MENKVHILIAIIFAVIVAMFVYSIIMAGGFQEQNCKSRATGWMNGSYMSICIEDVSK